MKKKGFTLIELLAIIVILAIIALIAVPVVLNIIDKARVSSYERSSENVLEAARLYYNETLLDKTMDLTGNKYDKVIKTVSGDTPNSGEIYITSEGKIAAALQYGSYCYKKGLESDKFTMTILDDENCVLPTAEKLKTSIVTNGDGLYKDDDGVYRYKGSNPNNYIMLGEGESAEEYRIIAIEEQGIKVVRSSSAATIQWDKTADNPDDCDSSPNSNELCPRYNNENSYCLTYCSEPSHNLHHVYYGCDIYASADKIKQNGIVKDSVTVGSNSGTVTEDSTIYNYLHATYYDNLYSVDSHIVQDATWNIGPVFKDSLPSFGGLFSTVILNAVKTEESNWTLNDKIGLPNVSDFIQSQLPGDHCIPKDITGSDECYWNYGSNNWMALEGGFFAINSSNTAEVNIFESVSMAEIGLEGLVSMFGTDMAGENGGVLPVVYLSLDIELSGEGTQGLGAYTIVES